jgi:hypothetical protein
MSAASHVISRQNASFTGFVWRLSVSAGPDVDGRAMGSFAVSFMVSSKIA